MENVTVWICVFIACGFMVLCLPQTREYLLGIEARLKEKVRQSEIEANQERVRLSEKIENIENRIAENGIELSPENAKALKEAKKLLNDNGFE
jgi:cell division protein ZapA (FtsZ GTPase activity inhibitor)